MAGWCCASLGLPTVPAPVTSSTTPGADVPPGAYQAPHEMALPGRPAPILRPAMTLPGAAPGNDPAVRPGKASPAVQTCPTAWPAGVCHRLYCPGYTE